ncbi:MAG: hypothetical protein ACYTED_16435 [Planctomycetota bacterium]
MVAKSLRSTSSLESDMNRSVRAKVLTVLKSSVRSTMFLPISKYPLLRS